jgi:hypothetical protein
MSETIVSLETIAGGAAKELFERELAEVLANIADVNTPGKMKRSITLKITFSPTDRRDSAAVNVDVSKSLAKRIGAGSQVWFGLVDGKRVAAEANPNQELLFDHKDTKVVLVRKGGE